MQATLLECVYRVCDEYPDDVWLRDRAGDEKVTAADFWRVYQELNPITVSGFEKDMRDLGFEFFRAAVRTEGRIEYSHPQLQNYSIHDLSTVELYLSAYNRK